MKDDVAQHVNHCARLLSRLMWRGLNAGSGRRYSTCCRTIQDQWKTIELNLERLPTARLWQWWHDDVRRRIAKKTFMTVPNSNWCSVSERSSRGGLHWRPRREKTARQNNWNTMPMTVPKTLPTTSHPSAWAKRGKWTFSPSTSSSSFHFKISHMRGDDANKNSMITGDHWDHSQISNRLTDFRETHWQATTHVTTGHSTTEQTV